MVFANFCNPGPTGPFGAQTRRCLGKASVEPENSSFHALIGRQRRAIRASGIDVFAEICEPLPNHPILEVGRAPFREGSDA
jgi:hypothetical protein